MRKIAFPLTLLSTVLVSLLPAVPAWAQAARTFVSAAGSDSNNCISVATPCRHFAAAYAATSTGGEIVALDPANYGDFTISQAVTVEGGGWSYLTPPANGTGITINASGSTVIIRNLQINGANATNSTGISLTGGSLVLENSALKFLSTGISVTNAKATLFHVDIIGNGTGVSASGSGVNTSLGLPFTGTTEVLLFSGSAFNNTIAYFMTDPGNDSFSILGVVPTTQFVHLPGFFTPFTTTMAGNGTLVSGTGTGCPCSSLGAFSGDYNPN
jgi:hypothetical protein